jgi:predicted alpha/beta-hydrolase family hydrolase
MSSDSYPITPPSELVEQWEAETAHTTKDEIWHVAVQAAQWGADQELEACCEWLVSEGWFRYEHEAVQDLRAARRPKPPSLKEQALKAAHIELIAGGKNAALIIRALEQLND